MSSVLATHARETARRVPRIVFRINPILSHSRGPPRFLHLALFYTFLQNQHEVRSSDHRLRRDRTGLRRSKVCRSFWTDALVERMELAVGRVSGVVRCTMRTGNTTSRFVEAHDDESSEEIRQEMPRSTSMNCSPGFDFH